MPAPKLHALSSTDDAFAVGESVKGKVVIVTGANSGIGLETTRSLLKRGAHVWMACRNEKAMKEAKEDVEKDIAEGGSVHTLTLDLGSFESIRAAAKEWESVGKPIDLLINNAGIMMCPASKTKDGLETQFGVNHVGHFLFTNLLLPYVEKAAPSRIINLTSNAHQASQCYPETAGTLDIYNSWILPANKAYGQSKTSNILFSLSLNKRMKEKGLDVETFAVHPGYVDTNLIRHVTEKDSYFNAFFGTVAGLFVGKRKTPDQGSSTTIYAATNKDLKGKGFDKSGLYLADCAPAQPRAYAVDEETAEKLWTRSEELVGQSF
jgi:NAD(P)-dependent dehydrogenase (short-subunit alcohol dehydrogenase family)